MTAERQDVAPTAPAIHAEHGAVAAGVIQHRLVQIFNGTVPIAPIRMLNLDTQRYSVMQFLALNAAIGAMLCALPLAAIGGAALGSASMNILHFGWYNASEGRLVTISSSPLVSADFSVVAGRGSSRAELAVSSDGSMLDNYGLAPVSADTASDLDLAPVCVGRDCGAVSGGFAAADATGLEYAYADQLFTGFFGHLLPGGVPGASLGLRADASLATGMNSLAVSEALFDSVVMLIAHRTFESYFAIELEAQTLATLTDDFASGAAQSTLHFEIWLGGGSGFPAWSPLNLESAIFEAGESVSHIGPSTLYSFDETGMFTVVAGQRYTIAIRAGAAAAASLESQPVPAPPSSWLLALGVGGLLIRRCRASFSAPAPATLPPVRNAGR
jgi:hypothetical protein